MMPEEENLQSHILSELLKTNDYLRDLDKKIEVKFASLPYEYVPRSEYTEEKRESTKTRRFALASLLGLMTAAGTFIGMILG